MGAIIVVDALWGDAGKGKMSAILCQKYKATLNIRAGTGTNAGHSVHLSDGRRVVMRQLPLGWLNPTTGVRVGSGVCVDPRIFLAEVASWGLSSRAKVDFRCPIIEDKHIEAENNDQVMKMIDSTKSGSGSARADFVMRRALQAKDISALAPYVTDVALEANTAAITNTVVIEGSQGSLISLALAHDYPYTTSDNCTAVAFADDVGLSWRHIAKVVLLVKCLPTRVGEGPLPYEMDRGVLAAKGLQEWGVVTGRPRRKAAAIDFDKLAYSAMINGATEIALTFCDHYDPEMTDKRSARELTSRLKSLMKKIEISLNIPVTYLDTGKLLESYIDLSEQSQSPL